MGGTCDYDIYDCILNMSERTMFENKLEDQVGV